MKSNWNYPTTIWVGKNRVKDLSIAAADTYVMDTEKLILSNNDTIQASASTGSVIQATVSYIGVS